MVVRGEVQLAVVREMRDARITNKPLFEDELVLVARPDHPFARGGHASTSRPSTARSSSCSTGPRATTT